MKKTHLLILIILSCYGLCYGNDIQILKERLTKEFLQKEFDSEKLVQTVAAQQPNGSWNDIDYNNKSTVQWNPTNHLNRLLDMCLAYSVLGQDLYMSQLLLTGILNGVEYWYKVNPKSNNWWHNEIGKQNILAPIAFLVGEKLPESLLQQIIVDFPKGTKDFTGQNKLWISEEMVWRGCLSGDLETIKAGTDSLKSVVKMVTTEGIMPDYSFRQHGPQLYSGGYGASFLTSNMQWAYRLRGLSFGYSKDNTDLLGKFVREGSLWMIRRNYWDYQVVGRNLARKSNGEVRVGNQQSASLNTVLRQFAMVDTTNRQSYLNLANHIEGTNDTVLYGNKYFYWSDFMVHRRPNYYFSVRMNSARTFRTEQGNNENVKGDYLSDGSTAILIDGDEYADIFPCWNWSHIPGVTSPERATPKRRKDWGIPGVGEFTGGVSDGKYGVAAYRQNWDSTQVNKAWILFDNEVVCLASNIKSEASDVVSTTLNQTLLKTDVWLKEAHKKAYMLTDNESKTVKADWIWQGNTGYIIPQHTGEISVSAQKIVGDWSSIGAYPKGTLETKNVFAISKTHGLKPKGASFAYIVVPGIDKSHFEKYKANDIKILANNDSLQLVYHNKTDIYGLVLYKGQSVKLSDKLCLTADNACLMLFRTVNGKKQLTLADPTQKLTNIHLTISMAGRCLFNQDVKLPQGDYKGKSVTIKLLK